MNPIKSPGTIFMDPRHLVGTSFVLLLYEACYR